MLKGSEIFNSLFMLLACNVHCLASEKHDSKPNVIFILADDLGYGDISYLNKDSKINTPNIDQLAKEGQNYMDAHSCSSVSTPSRYGCLTGRYAWRGPLKKGVLGGYSMPIIENNRPTIASMLKSEGYNTACIGKWHLGLVWHNKDGKLIDPTFSDKLDFTGPDVDYQAPLEGGPTELGFDYFYGISASLDIPPFLLIENNQVIDTPSCYYEKNGKKPFGRPGFGVKDRDPSFYLPNFTSKVEEKIDEYSKSENPFFIYFALNAPHTPVVPNSNYTNKSMAGDYGDYVVEVDDVVGRVMAALRKNGLEENTIVVITSDNGPETIAYQRAAQYNHYSSGELKGVKRDLWEGGHRIPFIFKWNKVKYPDKDVQNTVCLTDFYSTIASIVGHKLQPNEAPDSYSFLPLIMGETTTDRKYTIHHSCKGFFAIRKGDWVLIDDAYGDDNMKPQSKTYYESRGYDYEFTKGELYNLNADIREFKNEYNNKPEIVKELKAVLEKSKKE